ncbi:MAG: amidase [Candidatus Kariarchaeaceae archaeon]|jgi:amidase
MDLPTALEKVDTGLLSYVELIDHYLEQIKIHNPKINAIVTINEDATQDAIKCDNTPKEGILHGLPIVIKDTIETEGIRTTAGSQEFVDYIPQSDAEVIRRIKKAGGIILAKSNTPEMSLDFQTYNDIFGVTNNPYDLTKTAGGSSGGSAAAVAVEMAPLAIGSDLAGSLRIPASFCGVTTLRPTEGRIDFHGHIPPVPGNPVSTSEITIGPIAKSTMGVELIMQAICGSSMNLEYPSMPYHPLPTPKIEDINFALTTNFSTIPTDERIIKFMENIRTTLISKGGRCTADFVEFPTKEVQWAHNTYFKVFSESSKLDIGYKLSTNDHSPPSSLVLEAKRIRDQVRILLHQFLNNYDVWIIPTVAVLPFPHNFDHSHLSINGISVSYWKALLGYTIPFSLTGNPVVTLPLGFIDGLPVGVQVIGKRWKDEKLVSICRFLEQNLAICK